MARIVLWLGAALAASVPLVGTASAQTADTITCVSEAGQRQKCPAETARGVALLRETGTAACLLGNTWGYDASGVWVSDGCGGTFALGQARQEGEGDDFLRHFDVYGRFLAHGAFYNDEAELQNSASWIGFDFTTGDTVKVFARWEWGVNFIRGGTQFDPGAVTSGGFLTVEGIETPLLGNRLGYVGLDFGTAGRLTVGKQKSVHYDIGGYTTDRWNVFGGQGSISYPANTDGGELGTGRADQAVTYRLRALEILALGGQLQFANTDNDELLDGWGASVQVTVLPGLKVGGAWTERYFSQEFKDHIVNLKGSANYGIVGASFSSKRLDLAGVWSTQRNGDGRLVEVQGVGDDPTLLPVAFDGDGLELYGKAHLGRFSILGGFINYSPDDLDDRGLVGRDIRIRYLILGAEMHIKQNAFAYTEWRIDDSVDAGGNEGFNVFTLGLRYGFSMKGQHGVY